MKRLVASLTVLFLTLSFCFSQGAPKKVLSSSDVTAFVANYTAIEADLDALDGKYETIVNSVDFDEEASIEENFSKMRSLTIPGEIQAIFKRHGMGSNGFEKMIVITTGFQALEMDTQIKMYADQYKDFPEMQPMIEQTRSEIKVLHNLIHKADFDLIQAKQEDLRKLFSVDE